MNKFRALVGLLVLLTAGACSALSTPTATATIEPSSTPVKTATTLPTPISTATPSGPPTETPFAPFEATLSVDGINLRTNPGYLFAIKETLSVNSSIKVLGQAKGGEWLEVQAADGTQGWVFTQLVSSDVDLTGIPLIEPTDVQLLTGKVQDASGKPVSGLQFAITQTTGSTEEQNNAVTDATGQFYAYMPTRSSGMWAVIYTAISCSSNRMDQNCNCAGGVCGTVDPSAINVILPQTEDVLFTWK